MLSADCLAARRRDAGFRAGLAVGFRSDGDQGLALRGDEAALPFGQLGFQPGEVAAPREVRRIADLPAQLIQQRGLQAREVAVSEARAEPGLSRAVWAVPFVHHSSFSSLRCRASVLWRRFLWLAKLRGRRFDQVHRQHERVAAGV